MQFLFVYTKKGGSDGKNVFVSFIVVAVQSMRLDNAKGGDQWGSDNSIDYCRYNYNPKHSTTQFRGDR